MLDQEAAQTRTGGKTLLQFEQERLDVGTLWVRALARPRGISACFGHDIPVKKRKERMVALYHWIMLDHLGQGLLLKDLRVWYHGNKLLAASVGQQHFFLLCLQVLLLSSLSCLFAVCLLGIYSDPPARDCNLLDTTHLTTEAIEFVKPFEKNVSKKLIKKR